MLISLVQLIVITIPSRFLFVALMSYTDPTCSPLILTALDLSRAPMSEKTAYSFLFLEKTLFPFRKLKPRIKNVRAAIVKTPTLVSLLIFMQNHFSCKILSKVAARLTNYFEKEECCKRRVVNSQL